MQENRRHRSREQWSCRGSCIAGVLEEALDKIGGKARLIEMDPNGGRSDLPREMNAKKPFDDAHEINFASLGQQVAEQSFNRGIFREVYEVVNVETKGER